MLIKAKSPIPTKPRPTCGQAGNKVVQPIRCTADGEVFVYQTNQPKLVGDGVNRKNKDGVLTLGDDGRHLRNVRVDPDGTTVVRHDGPVEVVPHLTEVVGIVSVDNPVTVNPVTVANMPDHIRVQEDLHVTQNSIEALVAPINFEDYGQIVIDEPCKVYSIHLTVNELTFVEIVGITGEMWTTEFKFSIFPQFIQVNKVAITTKEYAKAGGYVIYEL
jgi:hypothetical protein